MSILPSKASFSALAAAAARALGPVEASVARHRGGGLRPILNPETIRYQYRHEIPSMADQRRVLRLAAEVDLLEARGFRVALMVPLGHAQRLLDAMRYKVAMRATYVREVVVEDLGWATAELTASGYLVVVDPVFAKMWERNEGGLRERAEARSRRVLDELRKGQRGRR